MNKLGSHNTMSYQPPRQWWAKLLRFTARCQSANLYDQFHKYGCRLFDFRVRYDKNGELIFAHGPVEFHGNVRTYILELNEYAKEANEPVYARLSLESNKPMQDQDIQEEHFCYFCEYIQKKCPNIIFFGGRRKYDWAKLFEFYTTEPDMEDKYSSTTGLFGIKRESKWSKLDDLCPWLYAKLYNKKNIQKGSDREYILMDFVNIR